jgi:hypothetical protein
MMNGAPLWAGSGAASRAAPARNNFFIAPEWIGTGDESIHKGG